MKRFLLSVVLTGLMLSAYSQDHFELSDSLLLNDVISEKATPIASAQNNYAVGIFGSSKLPIGYQLFFNLENIGKMRPNMGLLVNNQFSSHSNYDLSATIIKRNLFLHNARLTDVTSINIRTRKLHYSDREKASESYSVGYSLVYNGKTNFGAGIACDRGIIDVNGLMLSAGRFFPELRINLTGQMSLFKDEANWRAGFSKTFSLSPDSHVIYGFEVYYEEYHNYNDVSVGMIFYL